MGGPIFSFHWFKPSLIQTIINYVTCRNNDEYWFEIAIRVCVYTNYHVSMYLDKIKGRLWACPLFMAVDELACTPNTGINSRNDLSFITSKIGQMEPSPVNITTLHASSTCYTPLILRSILGFCLSTHSTLVDLLLPLIYHPWIHSVTCCPSALSKGVPDFLFIIHKDMTINQC